MGCGGSKSTAVVESNVNLQRHNGVKQADDVTIDRGNGGSPNNVTQSGDGNAIEKQSGKIDKATTQPNNRKISGNSSQIQHDSGNASPKHSGSLNNQPKKKDDDKRTVPSKSKEKSSVRDLPDNDTKQIAIQSPKGQDNNQLNGKPTQSIDLLAKKSEQIETTNHAPRNQPADENRTLKTASPFDPSVKVGKYRKDPIPVFGPDAFPLSRGADELTIEDTFWPGKRELIPDYNRMKELDKHAIEAPQRFRKDMDKLVEHLTSIGTSDLERLRVIFRWVAHNIAYNVKGFLSGNLGDNSAAAVFKSGLAVCAGYSNLLAEMCKKAGVECKMVHGYAKGAGYQPGKENLSKQKHAWNQVTLDGKPFLCDSTWAAGSVDTAFTRHWKEHEFLAEPISFGQSHLPNDLENQAIKNPYKSLEEWNKVPAHGIPTQFTGLQCLTHKDGIIEAPGNTCLVKVRLKRALYNTFCVVENENGRKLEGVVQHWWNGTDLSCDIRLPKAGRYSFQILGNLSSQRHDKDNEEILYPSHASEVVTNSLITYIIKATGSEKNTRMSDEERNILFGAPINLLKYGLTPVSDNRAIIETSTGRAHVVFKKIHPGICRIHADMHKFGDQNKKLGSSVYCEQFDEWVVCHIRCPSAGTFKLTLFVKSDSEANSCPMRYIVLCKGKVNPEPFPELKEISGTNAKFEEMGFRIKDGFTSTLLTSDGDGQLVICCDPSRNNRIIVDLKDITGAKKDDGSFVIEYRSSETEQIITVNLRLRQSGIYKLTLFGKEGAMERHDYLGYWVVVCRQPSNRELYPPGATNIGPNAEFHSLQLQANSASRVVCQDGEGALDVLSNVGANIEFISKLTKAKDDEITGQIFTDTFVRHGKVLARFHFRLNQTGIFAFRLFARSADGEKNDYIGVWLVVNDTICSKPAFPGRKVSYGPNAAFREAGIHADDGASKRLELPQGLGELSFTHKPGSNRRINAHLEIVGRGRLDQNIASMLIEGSWSSNGDIAATKLRLRIKEPGVYDLVVFAESEDGNSFTYAGVWLIDCSKGTTEPMFPDWRGTMGPRPSFFQMGLSARAPASSTLPADGNGLCTLQVFRSKAFGAVFNATDKQCQVSVTESSNSGKHTYICNVRLPGPGLYSLNMFASKPEEKRKEFMGMWLLEWV